MGERGPIPKRSSERRRTNSDSKAEQVQAAGVVKRPPVKGSWHPIAKRWFKALDESAQSRFYEPSDWATAYYVAEAMTINLEAGRFSSELFKAVMSAQSELLTTEGARRRVRVEIEREIETSEGVTAIDEYRRRLAEG